MTDELHSSHPLRQRAFREASDGGNVTAPSGNPLVDKGYAAANAAAQRAEEIAEGRGSPATTCELDRMF